MSQLQEVQILFTEVTYFNFVQYPELLQETICVLYSHFLDIQNELVLINLCWFSQGQPYTLILAVI